MPACRLITLIALLPFCVLHSNFCICHAADWPQWLGPDRDNSTAEKIAPWKGDLKVLWRQPAGEGNSSPIVAGGKVFVHAKVKDKLEEEVVAYNAADGKEAWRKSYPRVKFDSLYGNGPRATPAVAGGKLYTSGVTGVLTCWEADTGKQLWQVDTLKEFGVKNSTFGVSCSPLIEGNKVLVMVGGAGSGIVAYDAAKGTVAWKSQDDAASYASPVVFGKGDARQAVFLTAAGVVSVSPGDGGLFWRVPLVDKLLESSTTPVKVGDQLVASAITFGGMGIKLGEKDGKPTGEKDWTNSDLTCYFSTPVAVGDNLYLVSGNNPLAFKKPEATLHCVNAKTGKALWKKPAIGKFGTTLIRTGDNKLLLLDDAGNLALVEPNSESYKEVCRSKVCGETWAHPAVSDGKLFVRDNKELLCIELPR